MQMSDWKIGTRLGLAFGLLIVMMLGVVVIGLLRFGTVGTVNSRIIEEDWVKAEAANVIDTTTRANARRTMELVLATDAQHLQAIKAAIATNKKPSTRPSPRWTSWCTCPRAKPCWHSSRTNAASMCSRSPA